MNEITRIHLAKTPYNIEIEAHRLLRAYIDAIEKSLNADKDAMREIELRMSEILAERGIKDDTVITLADVESLQKQLGDPKDFAEEDAEGSAAPTLPKKRLMRDSKNAMLGGVCAGIAAYFGWDAVWVRIAAVILLFVTSGAMIPIYIVMLFVMPEAKTAAERLEMAGEPVTLEALKDNATKVIKTVEPVFLKLLRLASGVVFAIASVVAIMTSAASVGYIMTHTEEFSFFGGEPIRALSTSLMALGGVMLAVLCAVFAKMLFSKSAPRRLVTTTIIVILIGTFSFGSGLAIAFNQIYNSQKQLSNNNITKTIDTANLYDGIKSIDVRSRGINVHYTVSDTKRDGSYSYNSSTMDNATVRLTRLGDSLVVQANFKLGKECNRRFMTCDRTAMDVYLTGPAIDGITTNAYSFAYSAVQQTNLMIEQRAATEVILTSVGVIDNLDISNDSASLDAVGASVNNVTIHASRSALSFANVGSMNVTAQTDACSMQMISLNASHIGQLKLNGADWDSSKIYPCLNINVEDRN